jgi:hypothetical protein
VALEHEEVPAGPQESGCLAGPRGDVWHPDKRALACINEVCSAVCQGDAGHRADDVLAVQPKLVRPPLRGTGSDGAVVNADHRLRAGRHECRVIQSVAALQVHDLRCIVQDLR